MNYELAKQLKNEGFPQKEPNGFVGIVNAGQGDEHGRAYFPTLEELIEACGKHGKYKLSWERAFPDWRAAVHDNDATYGYGSTPTEAVARLWLALNKK